MHYEETVFPPCSWLKDVLDSELPWIEKVAGADPDADDPKTPEQQC
jgi:hypothetical protein